MNSKHLINKGLLLGYLRFSSVLISCWYSLRTELRCFDQRIAAVAPIPASTVAETATPPTTRAAPRLSIVLRRAENILLLFLQLHVNEFQRPCVALKIKSHDETYDRPTYTKTSARIAVRIRAQSICLQRKANHN